MTKVGVLALQGGFAAHIRRLRSLEVEPVEVRRVRELSGLAGLVIPGGESTTLLNLMADEPWFDALGEFHEEGGTLLGTCAGAILLSREVVPEQESLGLLDARIERNAFGRQVDSFETTLDAPAALGGSLDAVFIRAPRFRALGPTVIPLVSHRGEPVLVQQGRVLALTFHPELTRHGSVHAYFVAMTKRETKAEAGGLVPAGRIS
ncbi:MAG TPA: pyridoxal 5'-phosphate synthase glutaminase subunit PdxT [Candidatus Polarisedimenticolaceae bacterium]|nr:pyridoxal 5'-phosphate synthase glutaminase subunit PdxT [Candidatus Polarisedimenticolaceae bacterium]